MRITGSAPVPPTPAGPGAATRHASSSDRGEIRTAGRTSITNGVTPAAVPTYSTPETLDTSAIPNSASSVLSTGGQPRGPVASAIVTGVPNPNPGPAAAVGVDPRVGSKVTQEGPVGGQIPQ